jgi:(2Fe-2S) ferredoxin
MNSNNAEWEWGWFYLCNVEPGLPPYTSRVLRERAASWYHGVSPPSHQAWLDSLLAALRDMEDRGLTAGCVLANLHHRWRGGSASSRWPRMRTPSR